MRPVRGPRLPGPRRGTNPGGRLALWLGAACLAVAVAGCQTTVRRVAPEGGDSQEILARYHVHLDLPAGWRVAESPMRYLDSVLLNLRSPDGMVLVMELTPGEASDLEARAREARQGYEGRFPTGRFHPVSGRVGSVSAPGFEGTVVSAEGPARRVNLLFRCWNASGRYVTLQGQANAAVWSARHREVEALLKSLRVGPVH